MGMLGMDSRARRMWRRVDGRGMSSWSRSAMAMTALVGVLVGAFAGVIPAGLGRGTVQAGELGFLEEFALAEDREAVLQHLIPGTDDYFFYHALHAQTQGKAAEVRALMERWRKEVGETERYREIRNRQALLDYDEKPDEAIRYLRQHLGIHLNDQRRVAGHEPVYPTALDPRLVSEAAFRKRALEHTSGLGRVRNLEALRGMTFTDKERREFLRRVRVPDWPNLVSMLADDWRVKPKPHFGSYPIHALLTRAQLQALAKAVPQVRLQNGYIWAMVQRLQPTAEEDWRRDPIAREAYLKRLWAYVETLPDAWNSLKALVLYHQLLNDHRLGLHDKQRFLTYLKLPRAVVYINLGYLASDRRLRDNRAQLHVNYTGQTQLPPIGSDTELVRAYLDYFWTHGDDLEPYKPYIKHDTLRDWRAECMLLAGKGDADQWAKDLGPAAYKRIRDRVELVFAPTNPASFGVAEPVELRVAVKNVPKLLVKVYEINTTNYYRQNSREVPLNLELDGLVANREASHAYQEDAIRRVERTFTFPELKRRGVFVLEFIGGGVRSRAIVRKGDFKLLEQSSPAGQLLTVLDEADEPVAKATVYVGGREHETDDKGRVIVPFSTNPGRQPVVISKDGFSALKHLQALRERYRLAAGFYVAREQLLAGGEATLYLRPMLYLNGRPAPLKLVEEPVLAITATDGEGIQTTKEVREGLGCAEGKPARVSFLVPPRTRSLSFHLRAKVQNQSVGEKQDLAATHQVALNQIDATDRVEDLHLARAQGRYYLRLLGKSGEARAKQVVNLTCHHPDFNRPIHRTLMTDEKGVIDLGPLVGLEKIQAHTASSPTQVNHTWPLPRDQIRYQGIWHWQAGQVLRVPFARASLVDGETLTRRDAALFEMRGPAFQVDLFDKLRLKEGYLEVAELPAGDYRLYLKGCGKRIHLRVTEGAAEAGWLMGKTRFLRSQNPTPLIIQEAKVEGGALRVRLGHANARTRVHVLATRFLPVYSLYGQLAALGVPEPSQVRPGYSDSLYENNRKLGEEMQYILDRRDATIFVGNMLEKPSLLLNPWALRETHTGRDDAAAGARFQRESDRRDSAMDRGRTTSTGAEGSGNVYANLDFLAHPAAARYELVPDEKGLVSVPLKDLGDGPHLHVVAVDGENVLYQQLTRPESALAARDLRLADGLDPKVDFAERKLISRLAPKEVFTLQDPKTGRVEAYASVDAVYRLFLTLSHDAKLKRFGFILRWPEMKEEEKREHYGRFACHELNIFLKHKDPAFFAKVIQPYIANKGRKTFVDHYLLEADLTPYLEPWAYARLNAAEQALLARALKARRATLGRAVRERYELIPFDVERYNHLFQTALRGGAMDSALGQVLVQARGVPTLSDLPVTGHAFESTITLQRDLGSGDRLARNKPYEEGQGDDSGFEYNHPPSTSGERLKKSEAIAGRMRRASRGAARPTSNAAADGDRPAPAPELAETPAPARARSPASPPSGPAQPTKSKAKESTRYYDARNRERATAGEKKLREQLAFRNDALGALRSEAEVHEKTRTATDDEVLDGVDARWAGDPGVEDQVADWSLLRQGMRRYYRALPPTKEWAENNYYELPIEQQVASLVPVNAFWADYATHGEGDFLSTNLAYCVRGFPEMMIALAVLDLPFAAGKATVARDKEGVVTITAQTPAILYHQEIRKTEAAAAAAEKQPLLVGQNYFQLHDRYTHEGNQRREKYVAGEFLTHTVYGCQVILTNPTSATRKVDALLQIPAGALPVVNGFETKGRHAQLQPYGTQKLEYYFYFPAAGDYAHYPVRVAERERIVAAAPAGKPLRVVDTLSTVDKSSWDYISQNGTLEEVLAYLEAHNLGRCDLSFIAWRCKEKPAYEKILALLRERRAYAPSIWAYAFAHRDEPAMGEFLRHREDFLRRCGLYLESKLLTLDPFARFWIQHLEYAPLVNARVDKLGKRREILNPAFHQQYQRAMRLLSYKRKLATKDRLAVAYYLFLQDRVPEALAFFETVDPKAEGSELQYAYLKVYAAFYRGDTQTARAVADGYKDHPVPRWRNRFAAALQQLDEIEGKAVAVVDKESREQEQTQLAATEPSLDFKVESRAVQVTYQNLEAVTVNLYRMDIEMLFSRNPFVQNRSGNFNVIQPNASERVELDPKGETASIPLPAAFRNANVLVEVVGGGLREAKPYYANDLNVQILRNYGQLRVASLAPAAKDEKDAVGADGAEGQTKEETKGESKGETKGEAAAIDPGKPLSKVYIKVYARNRDGSVVFYKDGYTDLRGRFDYASVSTGGALEQAERFAILVLSETHGALIREVAPPAR